MLFPDQTEAIFGPMGYPNPLFILAVYSPAIAGISLVLRHHGLKGLGSFFIGVLAIAVILTPMFNAARGSILIAALYHFQMNGPAWPDAQPWDSLVFAAVAVIVVLLNRKTMLARDGAVTEVLMVD